MTILKNKKSVLIIGAGIGGLATAIHLARAGMDVAIYEKNAAPGGRCQKLVRDGHIFDLGPTMYLFPEIYTKFFASIGEDIGSWLTLIRTNPTYSLYFSDNSRLTLSQNHEYMREQLEKIEPGSYKKFLAYIKNGKKFYDIAVNKISTNALTSPFDYFNISNIWNILKTRSLLPHYAYVSRYFRSEKLRIAFTFQDSYLSLHPFKTQAMYSLFSYSEFEQGNFLLKGGMYAIVDALVQIAQKNGVKIFFNCSVKKIITEDNYVTGVLLENDDRIDGDYVVSNADLSYTYENLLPYDPYANDLKAKKYSNSAIVFHWALSKQYTQLETHNLFFSESYKTGFDEVLKQSIPPEEPHFYIQTPSRTDPTRAPVGNDTLTVITPINHIDPNYPINWEEYRDRLRLFITKRLSGVGMTEMQKNVKFEVSYLPTDWQNYLNLHNGAIYGLDHNLLQLGYLRPKRHHTTYKNMFFVGASNHPGSGIPTVLLSSQFTSKAILDRV